MKIKYLTLKHIPINKEEKKSSTQSGVSANSMSNIQNNANPSVQRKESILDKLSYHPIGFIKSLVVSPEKKEEQPEGIQEKKTEKTKDKDNIKNKEKNKSKK
jgi:hypothetical protein